MTPLVSIGISVDYPARPAVLNGLALDIRPGEIVGLAGLSGSGKSTLALALLGLLGRQRATVRGRILYNGRDLLLFRDSAMRQIRGREIALVLQAAASALNPNLTLGAQLKEAWLAHASGRWRESKAAIVETMNALDLDCTDAFLRRYPGEISIGQAQRVLIAMALIHQPRLLIMDEPTSSLDSISRAEVLGLVRKLNRERDVSILYISHDLTSVAEVCHRIAILHEGTVVETGAPGDIFVNPTHPLTQAFARAMRAPVEVPA